MDSPKTNRTAVGGWSQARYQRHVDDVHLHQAKEVVEVLERVLRDEEIDRLILAGDQTILATLREQLPPFVAERVVDVLRFDVRTPEREVLQATLEALREQDSRDDGERVARLVGQYRAGGLAVVGVRDTLAALEIGQVDELLLAADGGVGAFLRYRV